MKVLSLGCYWSLKIPLAFDFTFNSYESLSKHRANYFRQLIGLFTFDCSFWGQIFEYIGIYSQSKTTQRFLLKIYKYIGLSVTNPISSWWKTILFQKRWKSTEDCCSFYSKMPFDPLPCGYWYSMEPRFLKCVARNSATVFANLKGGKLNLHCRFCNKKGLQQTVFDFSACDEGEQ